MYRIIVIAYMSVFIGCVHMGIKKNNNRVMVIILNGPSASGKSSIQKEVQKLTMPNLWVKVGIDNLFDQPMPDITPKNMEFWQSENPIRWVSSHKDEEDNSVITLHVGEQGEKVAYAMNSAILAYAENGCNVIVDYIAYKKAWLDDLRKKLSKIKTIYVAVDIPLNSLEEREKSRGTSPEGHARSHYSYVYQALTYDLRVNSKDDTASEIAHKILRLVLD